MAGIIRVLAAGAAVWLLSTLLAVLSCGGVLSGDAPPAPATGAAGQQRALLRTAGAVVSMTESGGTRRTVVGASGIVSVLQDASALIALADAGVVNAGKGESARLALSLSRAFFLKEAEGGSSAKPSPSLSPSEASAIAAEEKREARRKRPKSGSDKALKPEFPPQDPFFTHQKCFIGTDEAEVRPAGCSLSHARHLPALPTFRSRSPPAPAPAPPPLPPHTHIPDVHVRGGSLF